MEAKVAVGTPVTWRPPHRSVLEALPHTALALGNNANCGIGDVVSGVEITIRSHCGQKEALK